MISANKSLSNAVTVQFTGRFGTKAEEERGAKGPGGYEEQGQPEGTLG